MPRWKYARNCQMLRCLRSVFVLSPSHEVSQHGVSGPFLRCMASSRFSVSCPLCFRLVSALLPPRVRLSSVPFPTRFHLSPFHFIISHLITSRSSRPIPFPSRPSRPSRPPPSHSRPSRPPPPHLMSCYATIPSRSVQSRPVPSHPIPSRPKGVGTSPKVRGPVKLRSHLEKKLTSLRWISTQISAFLVLANRFPYKNCV